MADKYSIEERDAIESLMSKLGIILPPVPTLEEDIDGDFLTTDDEISDGEFSVRTRVGNQL